MTEDSHLFDLMVQDILKRMVLFCKAAVEVHFYDKPERIIKNDLSALFKQRRRKFRFHKM